MNSFPMPDVEANHYNLSVERLLDSSLSTIYNAWTQRLDQWFAEQGSVIMQAEENTAFFFTTFFEERRNPHYGRFLRLEQDRLIELTWLTGPNGTKGVETVVTIELEARENGTMVKLSHGGFPDAQSRDQHEYAWPFVLEHLDSRMKEVV